MPTSSTPIQFERDGTSQAARRLPSLSPDSVGLDERGSKDLLAFAAAFARELVYFDTDNLPAGDWSALLAPGGDAPDLDAIARFMADPSGEGDDSPHRRPHLVLFLAFLHLLGLTRERINRLTGEHLDYYYRRYLGLRKKPAQPDSVAVIARLAPGAGQTLLPKGSLLDAGKDSEGGALVYRTDADLIVNRAQVADLYTVFVDKRVTGLREAREACVETGDDPRLAMFRLAYGDPLNDDQLPVYPVAGRAPDAALVDELGALVDFTGARLHLEHPEFAQLLQLKRRRQKSAAVDWRHINGFLQKMGMLELNDPAFAIDPITSPAFWDNFKRAFGGKLPKFSSLPGNVTGLEDLYGSYLQDPGQPDNLAFIRNKLHLEPAEFAALMAKKQEVDSDWRIVNGLLEVAGQRMRGDPNYRLLQDLDADPYRRASTDFDANVKAALGTPDFAPFANLFEAGGTELERYAAALDRVQAYFFCTLEEFSHLAHAVPANGLGEADWERCYAILAGAHARKVYADRLRALDEVRKGLPDKAGLEAMLRLATGQRTLPVAGLLAMLAGWWPAADAGMTVYRQVEEALTQPNPPPFGAWRSAAVFLEAAWRTREERPPVAQREEWLLLHASTDATSLQSSQPGDTPRWRTFGQRRDTPPRDQAPEARIGWSIASPSLCLSQGERVVNLTLVFPAEGFASQIAALLPKEEEGAPVDPADWPFRVEASGAKGWIAPERMTIAAGQQPLRNAKAGRTLEFTLHFGASAPALAALPGGASPWPMLRVLLQPLWDTRQGRWFTPYPLFRPLTLDRVQLTASVKGLAGLALANDDGPLAAGKPFEPFGASPATGSSLRFTHPELAGKRLRSLQLNLQWMKLPAADLGAHYANYGAPIGGNKDFSARLSLLDHGADIALAPKAPLFDAVDANKPRAVVLNDVPAAIQRSRPGWRYDPDHAPFDPARPATWQRSLRLELNDPDFQHARYPAVVAGKSIELATAMTAALKPDSKAGVPDPAQYKVNPPYTPTLKSFSVDYDCTAALVLDPADPLGVGRGEERVYHHHVFGIAEIAPDTATGLYPLLPAYDNEGELYLGLESATVPGEVAILFQMAEGSASPDLAARPVAWHYLDGNAWRSMADGGVLADSTRGLAQSGIIRFRLPDAGPGTLLPGSRYWLRAMVDRDADSVCDCIDIRAQAVSATWLPRERTAGHLAAPLAAGSIARTVAPAAGIAAVSQPYTSSGGRPAEEDEAFRRRVSERLRHKQRALTAWDYEHLILERFPAIYKAKCLPAASNDPASLGKVDVIVIPDVRGQVPFNPHAPKTTVGQLAEINEFIAGHVSPLAEVTVRNARYVPVRVRVAVRFLPGYDPLFFKARLNEALNRFLSPWAYDTASEMVIGGTIYASPIIDFLERQPGVDYVAALKLFKDEDGLGFQPVPDDGGGYRVRADRADGVLVADLQHEIDVIGDARFEDDQFNGIGYMKVELDFIVG